MIEGRHFRSAEARRLSLGDAIDRYNENELQNKRDSDKSRAPALVEGAARQHQDRGSDASGDCRAPRKARLLDLSASSAGEETLTPRSQ
jgi:hypothetical protein